MKSLKTKSKFLFVANQQGIILVLTLTVMAILFSIAGSFAIIIISDLRQAALIDDSMVAYYAADAGLEKSLFLLRAESNGDEINDIASLKAIFTVGDLIGPKGGAHWTINETGDSSSDFESKFFRQRLYNGQGVKLYFLGRKRESEPNQAKSIKIDWRQGLGVPKLQVVFTQLDPTLKNNILIYYTDINEVEVADSGTIDPVCYGFKDKDVGGGIWPSDYVVELKALGSGTDFIDTVKVTAYNTTDCTGSYNPSAISNITIKAVGTYNKSQQKIVAHLPPRDPLSGLFGFVLFSDEDITKGY